MTHRKPRTTCPHTGDLMYDCRCGQCDTPLDATPATPPHTETNAIMDRLFKRIESKLTPKLNTGTAMDMLILVAEAMRELPAESTPHTEPPMNVNSQPDRFLSGMTVEQPMSVEQARQHLPTNPRVLNDRDRGDEVAGAILFIGAILVGVGLVLLKAHDMGVF